MRNVPREKRFEEGRDAGQSHWREGHSMRKGERPFKPSAVKSLLTSERQFQAKERGFSLLPLVGLAVWPCLAQLWVLRLVDWKVH